jgi:hypothetical protein
MEKEKKKRKKCVRSAHVGALDGAARAVAWSDRTLKWFCVARPRRFTPKRTITLKFIQWGHGIRKSLALVTVSIFERNWS